MWISAPCSAVVVIFVLGEDGDVVSKSHISLRRDIFLACCRAHFPTAYSTNMMLICAGRLGSRVNSMYPLR